MEVVRDGEPQASRPRSSWWTVTALNVTRRCALLEPIAASPEADCGTRALEADRREFAVVVLDVNSAWTGWSGLPHPRGSGQRDGADHLPT